MNIPFCCYGRWGTKYKVHIGILLESLNSRNWSNDFLLVCDLKLCNMLLGIQSCTSLHSCPYCEGHKVNEKGENTNGRGKWCIGVMRTESNIWNNYSNYYTEGKGNRKKLETF